MVEARVSLAQRVEALEQISHARVVERVGHIEQRVSRIESAREAGEPHVATKADIARLEKLIVETKSTLGDRIGFVELSIERRFRLFLMWLIGTAIALAAVVIAAATFIVGQLS